MRWTALLVIALLCAGIGGVSTRRAAAQAGNTIRVLPNPGGGMYLASPSGFTLYIFGGDTPRSGGSACRGACSQQWPPAEIVGGAPAIDPQANGEVGTIALADGSQQLTYDGWPLYGYTGDKNPGEMNGQGVDAFGGTFYVATP